jgi:hypothetical protein
MMCHFIFIYLNSAIICIDSLAKKHSEIGVNLRRNLSFLTVLPIMKWYNHSEHISLEKD